MEKKKNQLYGIRLTPVHLVLPDCIKLLYILITGNRYFHGKYYEVKCDNTKLQTWFKWTLRLCALQHRIVLFYHVTVETMDDYQAY